MPNHKVGTTWSFSTLLNAYHADPQNDNDAHFLLYKGDEILALCLRHKFNPKPGEVWVGNEPVLAEWGKRLASLKDKKTLPLYYSPRNRKFYTFMGHYLITGDTEDPHEIVKRNGPVPFSRIVFLEQIQNTPGRQ
jgi:hypothetical protein